MTEPRVDRKIGETLEAWMDQVAPERAPTRLLEETFSRTMTTTQGRTYPWDRLRQSGSPLAWAPSQAILLLAVALIVVALGVGWGLGGGWFATPAPPSPSPSLAPSPKPSPSLSYELVESPPDPPPISITPEAVVDVTQPIAMASDGEAIWVLTETGGLVRIDPATNRAGAPIQLGDPSDLYNGLSADAGGVWATHWSPGLVYRVDPASGAVTEIETEMSKGVLATTEGVWAANTHDGAVTRIDPVRNQVAAIIPVGPTGTSGPNWLASGLGSIWVGIPNASTVVRIDPATDAIQARIAIPGRATPCGGFAIGVDAVWIPSCDGSDWLTRIDPATNDVVAIIDMGGRGFLPAIVNGAPWISVDRGDDPAAIFRIDPATNSFDRVLSPDVPFRGGGDMAEAAGSLWIVDGPNNRVLRLPMSAFGT